MGPLSEYPVYAVLPCLDYQRARAWYEDKLGMKPEIEESGSGWYRCGGDTWVILTSTPNAGTAQNTAVGFTVSAIESVMAELRSRGVSFLDYDMGDMGKTIDGLLSVGAYKVAWLQDSEGNIVELSQASA